jgi:hypothetical protein
MSKALPSVFWRCCVAFLSSSSSSSSRCVHSCLIVLLKCLDTAQPRTTMADTTSLTLHQVINNNSLVPVFRLFCASLRLDDYLSFYLDAREFKNAYSFDRTLGGKPVEQRAKEIFDKYFDPSSLTEIDMDPPVMEKLTEEMAVPNGDMFEKAQRYAFEVLELKALREFVRSEAYKNFRSMSW